ncbi:hypothetical protein G6011_06747 [Alternaria panax]|uniref:Uncharacterized protein n=1 Tax=Alternaria panax TaxID=48097 RepID=A0AAD4FG21_9PLEO|nr:hypothetical protein G6011_06747 [Alternaria panax]
MEPAIPNHKGFLDLPGEIRNKIYRHCLVDAYHSLRGLARVAPIPGLDLGHACRTTRAEYLHLVFAKVKFRTSLIFLEWFLKTFYPESDGRASPFAPLPACKLRVNLSTMGIVSNVGDAMHVHIPTMAGSINMQKFEFDLLWLVHFLHTHTPAQSSRSVGIGIGTVAAKRKLRI